MKEKTYFEHSRECERLARQVKMLQQQLKEQQLMEEAGEGSCFRGRQVVVNTIASSNSTERKVLCDLKEQLNSKGRSHNLDAIMCLMLSH